MTDDAPRAPRRWRDDPLSTFLAFAAVLLGSLYALEQIQNDELADATAAAQALAAGELSLPECLVNAAGPGGETLVVDCARPARTVATEASQRSPDSSQFPTVVFAGSDEQLVCPNIPAEWPDRCTARPLPQRPSPPPT